MSTTTPDCPLCLDNKLFKSEILAENDGAYLCPTSKVPGNYLIIPKPHVEEPTKLPNDWWQDFKELLAQVPEPPSDYNISLNVGKLAGQTLKHLHFWIIPRKAGSPNEGKGLAILVSPVEKE
jgi:diadenosine tetraphosphate (Ap4A) HIT family hydrolase